MKISYSDRLGGYVVSEQGKVLNVTVSLGDAERLAGLEPEPLERFTGKDEDIDLEEFWGDE